MDPKKTAKKSSPTDNSVVGFVNAFVDGQSFVETDAFAFKNGDGVVSGLARINDIPVCMFAVDGSVMKGAIGEQNAKKIVKAINNAVRMDKPLIAVWDSMGARFAEGIAALEGYGSILRAYTLAYGDIPVITVIKGNNLGISSYVAGLSDFVIMYESAVTASASPLVLSAKTGAEVKDVGSAKSSAQKGICTNTVKSDAELRSLVSSILAVFSGDIDGADDPNRVCKGLKAGVSADALIKELFDKDSFLPLRADFAPVVATGFATLAGVRVGAVVTDITKNDGRLSADACVKISEFLNVCENAETPVVFLTDCAGSEQGKDDASLIREMSNLIYSVHALDLDMFAVVYGKAIGSAYTALVSPCEYKIAWNGAITGAMDPEAAARLIYADQIKSEADKDAAVQKLVDEYGSQELGSAAVAKAGYFDNVIEPALTRQYLIAALLAHLE